MTYVITELCSRDGVCAEICPVEACVADPEHAESQDELLAKWQRLHPGEKPKVA